VWYSLAHLAACMRVMLSPFSRMRPNAFRVSFLTAAATRRGRGESPIEWDWLWARHEGGSSSSDGGVGRYAQQTHQTPPLPRPKLGSCTRRIPVAVRDGGWLCERSMAGMAKVIVDGPRYVLARSASCYKLTMIRPSIRMSFCSNSHIWIFCLLCKNLKIRFCKKCKDGKKC
jgi:hypothetical protein